MKTLSVLALLVLAAPSPSMAAEPADEIPRAGLELWYRADDGLVMQGTSITEWRDGSGRGNHARRMKGVTNNLANPRVIQAAANGKPVLRWDGSDSPFA